MPLEIREPLFFAEPSAWGDWLRRHHDTRTEAWVGFHRKGTGLASMTWSEAVDEALCWGWIDGICKRLNATSYVHRFTPRRPASVWSKVNIAKVEILREQNRMQPAGLAAFARRKPSRSGIYVFEQEQPIRFARGRSRELKHSPAAQQFFAAQTGYYRRMTTHWVESAKQEATKARRMTRLIEACAAGTLLTQFAPRVTARPAKKK